MPNYQRMTLALLVGLVLLAMTSILPSASAAAPSGAISDKFRSGGAVVVAANETVPHDLYITGSTAQVDGKIEGDLFVAAGTVNVTGPVTGSLYIGGGTVTVSGPVAGDVFIGGGNVLISSAVGRHLRAAGGSVTIGSAVQLDLLASAGTLALQPDARVGGDLIFGAGQMTLAGQVAGGVQGAASSYAKTGTVLGPEDVTITTSQPAPRVERSVGHWVLDQVQRYVGIVLVGALMLAFASGRIGSAAARLRERPLASLGFGALGILVFVPALIAVIIATVLVAIPLGMLGLGRLVLAVVLGSVIGSVTLSFALLMVVLFVAAVVVGLAAGLLSLERAGVHARGQVYLALALGVLAMVLLTALPVVGWVAQFVIASLGLGALLLELRTASARTATATASSQAAPELPS